MGTERYNSVASTPSRPGPGPRRGKSEMARNQRQRSIVAAGVLAVIVGLFVVVLAPPAAAQDGGPYGSTTTTAPAPPGQQPSCQLRTREMAPGARAAAAVRAVPRGSTVRLLFDGEEVARAEADGPGQSATVNIEMEFVVPSDAESGPHEVVAVGPGFTARCEIPAGGGAQVLGTSTSRSRGGLLGRLPRTGVFVALLLVLAAALLLVGRLLVDAAGQRRHAAARDATVARAHRSGTAP